MTMLHYWVSRSVSIVVAELSMGVKLMLQYY